MVFKDTESLASLYAGITKQAEPSREQLVEQAPLLSNTGLSKDQDSIENIYEAMRSGHAAKVHAREHQGFWNKAKEETDKVPCPCTQGKKCTKKGCVCKACNKALKESEDKPDYMDVDEDGDKKEPTKKALKDKKEEEVEEALRPSNFKTLFNRVISEAKVNKQAQYDCTMKDGSKKVLKGESVLMMKDKIKSYEPTHKK